MSRVDEWRARWERLRRRFARWAARVERARAVTGEVVEPASRVARVLGFEGRFRARFVERAEALVAGLGQAWREAPEQRAGVLEVLRSIACEWPVGAPQCPGLLRLLVKTMVVDTRAEELEASEPARGAVIDARNLLEAYLRRFGAVVSSDVLLRAGADPWQFHERVRDAAWFAKDYGLAERMNRFVLESGAHRPVDELTERAWLNQLFILRALGKEHALRAYVERLEWLCRQHGRETLLDEVAAWKTEAHGPGTGAAHREGADLAPSEPAHEGGAPSRVGDATPATGATAGVPEIASPPRPAAGTPRPLAAALPEVIDAAAAASLLGVSRKLVYQWAQKGTIPRVTYDGSTVVRFETAKLLAFRESRSQPGRVPIQETKGLRGARRRLSR